MAETESVEERKRREEEEKEEDVLMEIKELSERSSLLTSPLATSSLTASSLATSSLLTQQREEKKTTIAPPSAPTSAITTSPETPHKQEIKTGRESPEIIVVSESPPRKKPRRFVLELERSVEINKITGNTMNYIHQSEILRRNFAGTKSTIRRLWYQLSTERIPLGGRARLPGALKINEAIVTEFTPTEMALIIAVREMRVYAGDDEEAFTYGKEKQERVNYQDLHLVVFAEDEPEVLKGWLNDSLINFYVHVLNDRSGKRASNPHSDIFLDSWVLPQIKRKEDYTRGPLNPELYEKFFQSYDPSIYQANRIFIPWHVGGNHWVLVELNMLRQTAYCYDSLGVSRAYLIEESLRIIDKIYSRRGADIAPRLWIKRAAEPCPQQDNGRDCGVFVCKNMEMAGRSLRIKTAADSFSQADIPIIRQMLLLEIITAATFYW